MIKTTTSRATLRGYGCEATLRSGGRCGKPVVFGITPEEHVRLLESGYGDQEGRCFFTCARHKSKFSVKEVANEI